MEDSIIQVLNMGKKIIQMTNLLVNVLVNKVMIIIIIVIVMITVTNYELIYQVNIGFSAREFIHRQILSIV